MSKHIITGKIGEDLAVTHLLSQDYTILERNWRFSRAEIDIIAKKENIVVFVEVKTRSSDFFGKPEEFLTARQENMISDAASRYLEKIQHDWEFRFDIISILVNKNKPPELKHFEDAFFPGLK